MKDVREVIAEVIEAQLAGNDHWDKNLKTGQILSALKEAGYVVVPVEPTAEMRLAWVAANNPNEEDLHERVPLIGTGQGDLTYVPKFENVFYGLKGFERWTAMLTASQDKG